MAELKAIGRDLKGLSVVTTFNSDGSAVLALTGNPTWRPLLYLTAAEAAALRVALTPPQSRTVIIGVNGGSGWGPEDASKLIALGITSERQGFEPGSLTIEASAPIAQSLANGFKRNAYIVGNINDNLPLTSAALSSTWISSLVAQAKAAVAGGQAAVLELMNEPYLKGHGVWEPVTYAKLYLAAKQALGIAGITVPLGFVMMGDYQRADKSWSQVPGGGGWIGDAVAACPELKAQIDCLISHPYGKRGANSGNCWGPGAMEVQHAQAVALGIQRTDVYVTEVGLQYKPGVTDALTEPTEAAQAAAIDAVLGQLTLLPYVKGIWYYNVHDDGTGTFGLVNSPWTPRPALAVVAKYAA